MTKRLPVLAEVRVATPCRADWARMRGSDRVRHCGECDQRVYDLSELTRVEAEALIVATEGRMCVRFYERADGTMILRDCDVARPSVVARGAAAVALAGALGCGAQHPQPTQPHEHERTPATHAGRREMIEPRVFMGVVMQYEPPPEIREPPIAAAGLEPEPEPTKLTHELDRFLEQPKR